MKALRNGGTLERVFGDLVLLVDIFAACIETGILPTHGSPCHRKARQAVDDSGMKPQRKRRRLPPNARLDRTGTAGNEVGHE